MHQLTKKHGIAISDGDIWTEESGKGISDPLLFPQSYLSAVTSIAAGLTEFEMVPRKTHEDKLKDVAETDEKARAASLTVLSSTETEMSLPWSSESLLG